ncbi:MAG: hypothetical protein FWB72_03525 [Firmicutes bacterium]|nr:hypothetical protein [Bacillota bacterium]
MKRFTKILLAIIIFATVSLTFVGCSNINRDGRWRTYEITTGEITLDPYTREFQFAYSRDTIRGAISEGGRLLNWSNNLMISRVSFEGETTYNASNITVIVPSAMSHLSSHSDEAFGGTIRIRNSGDTFNSSHYWLDLIWNASHTEVVGTKVHISFSQLVERQNLIIDFYYYTFGMLSQDEPTPRRFSFTFDLARLRT